MDLHSLSGWCVLPEALIVSKLLRQQSIPELAMQHRNFHFQLYVEESCIALVWELHGEVYESTLKETLRILRP